MSCDRLQFENCSVHNVAEKPKSKQNSNGMSRETISKRWIFTIENRSEWDSISGRPIFDSCRNKKVYWNVVQYKAAHGKEGRREPQRNQKRISAEELLAKIDGNGYEAERASRPIYKPDFARPRLLYLSIVEVIKSCSVSAREA